MMNEAETVEVLRMEITKLDLQPTDVLVMRLGQKVTGELGKRLQEIMKQVLGPGRKVLFVDPGTDFVILRQKNPGGEVPITRLDIVEPSPAS